MASKFNVNIQGGSGSIVMGDHTCVNINSKRSNSGVTEPSTVTIERGIPKGSRLPSNQGGRYYGQETNLQNATQKGSVINKATLETNVFYNISQGYALVIHNKYFDKSEDRNGSEKDVEAINSFCEMAGIVVNKTPRKTEDLKATEIEELVEDISEKDFSRYDAFLCFILSHGKEGEILGVDNVSVKVQDIINKFRDSPSLVGKPKVFFIQACRGSKTDEGVEADSHKLQEPTSRMHLPTDADLLIAYSSVDGYESYRSREIGSWFIMTLIEQLKDHAHYMHLMDILILVNQKIAEYETTDGRKQMPCQLSTLTKFVYFNVPSPKLQ